MFLAVSYYRKTLHHRCLTGSFSIERTSYFKAAQPSVCFRQTSGFILLNVDVLSKRSFKISKKYLKSQPSLGKRRTLNWVVVIVVVVYILLICVYYYYYYYFKPQRIDLPNSC